MIRVHWRAPVAQLDYVLHYSNVKWHFWNWVWREDWLVSLHGCHDQFWFRASLNFSEPTVRTKITLHSALSINYCSDLLLIRLTKVQCHLIDIYCQPSGLSSTFTNVSYYQSGWILTIQCPWQGNQIFHVFFLLFLVSLTFYSVCTCSPLSARGNTCIYFPSRNPSSCMLLS